MTPIRFNRIDFVRLTLIALLFLAADNARADCPNQTPPAAENPMHMLVLGDSIMWGQGLRPEEKFSSRIKCWLQEKLERQVAVHIEAHSGALVAGVSPAPPRFLSADGEVNLATPTVNEELDRAIDFYKANRATPSLTLLNGCINDVGVKNLLAVAMSLDNLREHIKKSCGQDMQRLLVRVKNSFPNSQVLVTNYYPIVSEQSDDNAFLRLLVKKLNSEPVDGRRLSDKEMRQRLIAISNEWYRTSTASLAEAVTKANEVADQTSPPALFVEVEFGPEHVFGAPDSLLWNFRFAATDVTGLAKIVAVLSFGTAAYKPNDHVRDQRVKSCEQTFKKPKEKEDKAQKRAREDLFLICRYASLGHPNQMGALIYTEAIKGRLIPLLDKAGWKRDTNHLSQQ